MPSKYTTRSFTEEGVYHIYNKGVEKREIFKDRNDYELFLYYLAVYTQPLEKILEKHPNLPFRLRYNNLAEEIDVLVYTLLPTHFHLIIRQHSRDGIPKLLKQVTNAYTYYYNRKYNRSGNLMQGKYKAVQIDVEKELTNIARHLDREAYEKNLTAKIDEHPWSSFHEYGKESDNNICKKRLIRSFLTSTKNYCDFVHDTKDYEKTLPALKEILIEN